MTKIWFVNERFDQTFFNLSINLPLFTFISFAIFCSEADFATGIKVVKDSLGCADNKYIYILNGMWV